MQSTENLREGNIKLKEFMEWDISIEFLNFHDDWNLLHKVIDKVEGLGYEVFICKTSTQIGEDKSIIPMFSVSHSSKILRTHKCLLKFIKWHNTTKAGGENG
jgi:hypothetical protein